MMSRIQGPNCVFKGSASIFVGLAMLLMIASPLRAEDRRMLVILANPPRTFALTGGVPANGLPSLHRIRDRYFDQFKDSGVDQVDSFAEFWTEISYGEVTVSGDVVGWINLPWSIDPNPNAEDPITGDPSFDLDTGKPVFINLNDHDPNYNFGLEIGTDHRARHIFQGEPLLESGFLINYDINGDEEDPADPLYNPHAALTGSPRTKRNMTDDGVFTPGERFKDADNDRRYDVLNEWCDGLSGMGPDMVVTDEDEYLDEAQPGLGGLSACDHVNSSAWNGWDEDGTFDFPEVYEDFIRRWDSDTEEWIRVSDAYIQGNYNGHVEMLLNAPAHILGKRFDSEYDSEPYPMKGNKLYNPPDNFVDMGNAKLMRFRSTHPSLITPRPDWLGDFWSHRYNKAPPYWNERIESLVPFDPENPDPSLVTDPGGEEEEMPFEPDAGGLRIGAIDHVRGNGRVPDFLDQPDGDVYPDEYHVFYDGPAEYDDLASSIYHEGPHYACGRLLSSNGDHLLGEITSPNPWSASYYGQDIGGGSPELPFPDGVIPAAGPLAVNINGANGYDAGNLYNLELLTWRQWEDPTHVEPGLGEGSTAALPDPFGTLRATDGFAIFFRSKAHGTKDYNLDGLLDQGEYRSGLSESYTADPYACSAISNGVLSAYPFNRDRLLEDALEAVDGAVDFDAFLAGGDPANQLVSTLVLLPPDSSNYLNNAFAPTLVDVANLDVDDPVPGPPPGRLQFSSVTLQTDDAGLGNIQLQVNAEDYAAKCAAALFGALWEGWPFLFDYDTLNGIIWNFPMGAYDVMANSWDLVHPNTVLKAGLGGHFPHTPWLEPTDLRTVLTPGVEQDIIIPPCEFIRDGAVYFIENPTTPLPPGQPAEPDGNVLTGETFVFYQTNRIKRTGGMTPNFDQSLPGAGLMIMHTDLDSDPEGLPQQQRIGSHFRYMMVQADGYHQLENGYNYGDAGDPFPGSRGVTEWNSTTDPGNLWYDGTSSGLEILDIVTSETGSRVTMKLSETDIPTLSFIRPPGLESVSGTVELVYEANDHHGGTRIQFFITRNPLTYACPGDATCRSADAPGLPGVPMTPLTKSPGLVQGSFSVRVSNMADGEYYFYARLTPGIGGDGEAENDHSDPHPGPDNIGNGSLRVTSVNIGSAPTVSVQESKLELWTFTCTHEAGDTHPTTGAPVIAGRELWRAEGSVSGIQNQIWRTGLTSGSDNDEIGVLVRRAPVAGRVDYRVGDTFTFYTTGLTPMSRPMVVENGAVEREPIAVLTTDPDPASGTPPFRVEFDASESYDVNGKDLVAFRWDFDGDGTFEDPATDPDFEDLSGDLTRTAYTYRTAGDFDALVEVENDAGRTAQATAPIHVINDPPVGTFTISDLRGAAPLYVVFDASNIRDPEGGRLTYNWDFDDAHDPNANPGDRVRVTHTYDHEGVYDPQLTVTDIGGAQKVIKASDMGNKINVGNELPTVQLQAVPPEAAVGVEVRFIATATDADPGDEDNLIFTFDFRDGSTRGPTQDNDVTHAFLATGTYNVEVTVEDGNGGEATATTRVVIMATEGNNDPDAYFVATPLGGPGPLTVNFNATGTTDPDGDTLSYAWDFDDGSFLASSPSNSRVTHVFDADGSYLVQLTVSDGNGGVDTFTRTIQVGDDVVVTDPDNRAPVASAVASRISGTAPLVVFFDPSASYDPDGDFLTYVWDWDDGTTTTGAINISHQFNSAGTYNVTLTVSDGRGGSDDFVITITVIEKGPNHRPQAAIVANPLTGQAPLTVNFDASLSTDADGDPLTYEWNFGDGTPAVEERSTTHTFTSSGQSFVVTLTVNDGRGGISEATVVVTTMMEAIEPPEQPVPNGAPPPWPCAPLGQAGLMQMLCMMLGIVGWKFHYARRRP